MTITVYGTPGPQGSKKFVGMSKAGRGLMVESSAKVRPWREAVKWGYLSVHPSLRAQLQGAVSVEMIFTLPKPKSAPKTRRSFPDKKPDIDKLCRSTLDALVQVGAIEDDARVVRLAAQKVFPGESAGSLSSPGVVITIGGIAL